MDKAILVIDMPKNCYKCPLAVATGAYDSCCITGSSIIDYHSKFTWCPLKPAPEKQDVWYDDDEGNAWVKGYNNCVREIMGE